MTILFNQWTPANTLADPLLAFAQFNNTYLHSGVSNPLPTSWMDIVPDPLGGDFNCLRMTVKTTDQPTYDGARTEITVHSENHPAVCPLADWAGEANTGRWYHVRWLIPESFDYTVINPRGAFRPCIFQSIEKDDTSPADEAVAPAFWVLMQPDGHYTVFNSYTNPADATQTTLANYRTRLLYRWPIVKNRWVDFVLRAKWGWTTTNTSLEIWVDKRKVFSETGTVAQPNTYRNEIVRGGGGHSFKFGLYEKWDDTWKNAVKRDRFIYHSGAIVADLSSTFSDLYPEAPGTVELSPRYANAARQFYGHSKLTLGKAYG